MTWFDFFLDHYIKILTAIGITLTVVTAILTILLMRCWPLVRKIPPSYRKTRKFCRGIAEVVEKFPGMAEKIGCADECFKTIPDLVKRVENLAELTERFPAVADKIERLDKEFTPNGGSTIIDVITKNGGRLESIEQAVRLQGTVMTLLVEECDEAWVLTDTAGEPVMVSGHFTVLTGMTLMDMVNDGWSRMIHPADLPKVVTKWNDAKSTSKPFVELFRIRNVQPKKMPDGSLGEHDWFKVHNIAMTVVSKTGRAGWKSVFSVWAEHMQNAPVPSAPTNQAVTIPHAAQSVAGALPAPAL